MNLTLFTTKWKYSLTQNLRMRTNKKFVGFCSEQNSSSSIWNAVKHETAFKKGQFNFKMNSSIGGRKHDKLISNTRLSQKNKKFEYQKSLLTLDVGWLDKLSCKISASYLENRKSSGCLKFQWATNKIKKSLFSKIDFYFKKLWFFYLKMDYESICWCICARNIKTLANFHFSLVIHSLLKLKMARWFSVFKIGC